MRLDEQGFLRMWAGNSAMPMLLVYGMRSGYFDEQGRPMDPDRIAAETGFTRKQVNEMLARAEAMIVKESDNETADRARTDGH